MFLLAPLRACILAVAIAPQGTTDSVPTAEPPPSVFQRIAVIGASVSDGFGLQAEAKRRVRLADVVDAAVRVEHGPVWHGASELFFLAPEGTAARVVDETLAREPSLVIAIDFLFWLSYGNADSEEERLDLLDVGLDLLDRFECPLLVGDLPDMTPALEAELPMLHPRQVPEERTLRSLNGRLRDWAKRKPSVDLIPLAAFVRGVFAGEVIELRGNRLDGNVRRDVLQRDFLHPNVRGTAALVVLSFDTLLRADESLPEEAILWDLDDLAAGFLPSSESEEEDEFGDSGGHLDDRFERPTPVERAVLGTGAVPRCTVGVLPLR